MLPRPVIIDTDPGQDDAIALLLALASPELTVRGITTVAGNVPVPLTTRNALRVRALAGADDIPVYRGCPRPMVNELVTAEHVHGATGLDGPDLPEPAGPAAAVHAVEFLVAELTAAPERSTTVCLLGPMTNLATALVLEPAVAAGIDEVVIMGGSLHEGGNITSAAEFNVFVDPHAAHVVLTSGLKTTLLPLDVTHRAQATPARVAALAAIDTPVGRAVAAMLEYAARFDVTRFGFAGFPLHDPCVVAYLLDPGMFTARRGHVSVVLERGEAHGMTVVDWWEREGRKPNASVLVDVAADRFYSMLTERLGRL
jgi:purine nucleosidase